jgi:hypothetical protein
VVVANNKQKRDAHITLALAHARTIASGQRRLQSMHFPAPCGHLVRGTRDEGAMRCRVHMK